MCERDIELVRRIIDAYNARDVEAYIAYCNPSVEFHSAFASVGGAVYHGHDGVRKFFRDMQDAWGGVIRIEPEAYFDLGEHTLAFYALHARGRHSGADVAMPVALLARWRDGLAVYAKGNAQSEEALSPLGLSEDELEPIQP